MELKDSIEVKSGLYEINYANINGRSVQVLVPNPNISDEERLSRDPYYEMLEQASEQQKFAKAVLTQNFVNDYLKRNGLETITKQKAQKGKRDIMGILTRDYIVKLQKIVMQYANLRGIDLFQNRERKSPIMGVMSSNEKQIADMLINEYEKSVNKIDNDQSYASKTM